VQITPKKGLSHLLLKIQSQSTINPKHNFHDNFILQFAWSMKLRNSSEQSLLTNGFVLGSKGAFPGLAEVFMEVMPLRLLKR